MVAAAGSPDQPLAQSIGEGPVGTRRAGAGAARGEAAPEATFASPLSLVLGPKVFRRFGRENGFRCRLSAVPGRPTGLGWDVRRL